MVLEARNTNRHNLMLGKGASSSLSPSNQVPDCKSKGLARFLEPRPPKRLKHAHNNVSSSKVDASQVHKEIAYPRSLQNQTVEGKQQANQRESTESEAESAGDGDDKGGASFAREQEHKSTQTDLEQALPAISTDRDAIAEYELMRAQEAASNQGSSPTAVEYTPGKTSIYVDAFFLALDTVLSEESHLFSAAERRVFDEFRRLSYEAQYLYVRLFLRKTNAWFRVGKLGYHSDIADMDLATQELFRKQSLLAEHVARTERQANPGEPAAPEGVEVDGDEFSFADNSAEHITTLEEASSLLLLDELKEIAKDAKVQGKNKSELLRALRRTSGRQTSLGFANLHRTDTEDSARSMTPADSRSESPVKGENRDAHFTAKILVETGPCIRLSVAPFRLFERVHLVFYRSTEWTEKSLTTIILARIARRNFPSYLVSRSANVFPSRSLLLEFEASLRTQFRVDNILEFNGTPTKETLEEVLAIFDDVYPRWKALLCEEQRREDSIYLSGEGAYLRRLSPAWVYTRIIHKAAGIMGAGRFKEHKREHLLLTELLEQRLFHTSRRGAWYQRKALLEEHYMGALTSCQGRSPLAQKKHWRRIALKTCEEGLQDNLVHIIYHYDLQKRIAKLEKALKIPKRLQHEFSQTTLTKAVERAIEGVRIERSMLHSRRGSNQAATSTRRGGQTIWLDPREANGECRVEAMCLSWYRDNGWKGYHSEGGIVRTLFALLFFDIIFTYVPNVFQTPFQTCPLDLHTDAFYPTRMSEINARLAQIANGKAEALIRDVWIREAEKQTSVVGLDWSFELDDLLEIAICFEGQKLATLCKVMAQEYAERGGGVPDLFLWRLNESGKSGRVCFSEVKSENDRLSDTQRLWIHVLTGAGVQVELCKAVAREVLVKD